MVRPTEEQIVYLDLSEPDSVVLYGEEETASGIQRKGLGEDIHATEVYVQICFAFGIQPTDETGVIATIVPLILDDEMISLLLGKTANGWSRV